MNKRISELKKEIEGLDHQIEAIKAGRALLVQEIGGSKLS